MLTELQIENFKGWEDTGVIKMAPITLFFGANSSGKSSIGQFLMMLKQTVESQDRKIVFYTGSNRSAVQLGSFNEMVYKRDITKQIKFHYRWSLSEEDKRKHATFSTPLSKGTDLEFDATIGCLDDNAHTVSVVNFSYSSYIKSGKQFSIGMQRNPKQNGYEYEPKTDGYTLKRRQGRVWNPGSVIRFYGFPDVVTSYFQQVDFLQDINLLHERLFSSLSYLGPLRMKPERLYSWSGASPESVGNMGENTIAAILAAKGRRISLGYKQRTKDFSALIAEKLKQMQLIDDFYINPISEHRRDYEVKVKTRGSADFVDLPDVGFGISQVLPVLVQCFYAPRGSIILMEQPEIHLHPNAQALLADVMIDVIKSKENGKTRDIQLIIETHSEHFLRRLQRRIAEENIENNSVAAYFVDITKLPTSLEKLKINEMGTISNWPKNFFGDEMGDIIAQTKAALQRETQVPYYRTEAE